MSNSMSTTKAALGETIRKSFLCLQREVLVVVKFIIESGWNGMWNEEMVTADVEVLSERYQDK